VVGSHFLKKLLIFGYLLNLALRTRWCPAAASVMRVMTRRNRPGKQQRAKAAKAFGSTSAPTYIKVGYQGEVRGQARDGRYAIFYPDGDVESMLPKEIARFAINPAEKETWIGEKIVKPFPFELVEVNGVRTLVRAVSGEKLAFRTDRLRNGCVRYEDCFVVPN
jgi:hypothetical protein